MALRTLHEVFASTPGDVVEAVVFNGRVSTIDRATGSPTVPICSAWKPSDRSSRT